MSVHSWKIVESGGFYLGSRTHIHFLNITFLSYMSEPVKTYPIFLSVTKTSVFRLMIICKQCGIDVSVNFICVLVAPALKR